MVNAGVNMYGGNDSVWWSEEYEGVKAYEGS